MKNKKLETVVRIFLAVGTLVSLFFVPWIVVWAWILPLPDTVTEQMEQAVDHGFDGIVVYAETPGKSPQLYAAGWHDREAKIPADPTALFKIASISKLYVAVSIAKLVNEGKLSLDKTLAEYFPELVGKIKYADKITLKSMVQHTSGIANYTDSPNYWGDPPNTKEATLQLAINLPPAFEPNTSYGYSNTNYLLLRHLIEKVVGYDYQQFIKERILTPLDLRNTFASIKQVDIERVMSGYYVGYDGNLKENDYGMLATAENVGKFLRALNNGSVFEDGEQAIYSSIYVYNHTGLVPGYQSIAKYHKDSDMVVVQFTSTTDFQGYHRSVSEVVYSRVVKILTD